MFEEFVRLIDPSLLGESGKVFYSGRKAFSSDSKIYLLGLNPAGIPSDGSEETIGKSLDLFLNDACREEWSAYCDEKWKGRAPGSETMQIRVRYLLNQLGLAARSVPASNLVFVRSARWKHLTRDSKQDLLERCWPVHKAIIERLQVQVIVCMGKDAGGWVREKLDVGEETIDVYTEDNKRRWRSEAHKNANGQRVLTLTHPSVAKWCACASNPTALAKRALAACP